MIFQELEQDVERALFGKQRQDAEGVFRILSASGGHHHLDLAEHIGIVEH